jgi:hypothetical protein
MSLSDELRNAHQSAKTHEAICQSLIKENIEFRNTIAELIADNAELVSKITQDTSLEMISRLRKEREEAFERASLFARHADRLEKALRKIMECPCCEQYTCAESANLALSEACRIFNEEWSVLHADK